MKEQPISNKQELTEKNLFTKSNLTTNVPISNTLYTTDKNLA